MRALLCALLLSSARAQYDPKAGECDFVNAGMYSPGYNLPDIVKTLKSGLPFWCYDFQEMHGKNDNKRVVGTSDRYYSIWEKDCPCHVSECCVQQFYCESGLYHQFQWCYRGVGQCDLSPKKGLYLSGCGCYASGSNYVCSGGSLLSCPTGTHGVEQSVSFTQWRNDANTGWKFANNELPHAKDKSYAVTVRGCGPCPAGSANPYTAAEECDNCPAQQYQPETGKTACIACAAGWEVSADRTRCEKPACLVNTASPKGFWDATIIGLYFDVPSKQCKICDPCMYVPSNIVTSNYACPAHDGTNWGLYNGVCTRCGSCPVPGKYATTVCVFDQQKDCIAQYRNTLDALVPGEVQPFVPGFQRNPAYQGAPGRKGEPGFYATCNIDFWNGLAGHGMQLRVTNTTSQNGQKWIYPVNGSSSVTVDRTLWDRDCDIKYSGECQPKFTGVWDNDQLLRCASCPPDNEAAAGLSGKCYCAQGFAQRGNLTQATNGLPQVPNTGLVFSSQSATCLNCTDVMKGVSLLCTKNTTAACPEGQQPDNARGVCVPCAPGRGSKYGGACELCPKGTYSKGGMTCISCTGGTFSNAEGATQCVPMRAMCAQGEYLLPPGVQEQGAADNSCHPCKTCSNAEVKVTQVGHNNTCSGALGEDNYFACYPIATLQKVSPNVRLTFKYAGDKLDSFQLETCSVSKLPKYADFAPLGASTSMPGAQCHFACLYGVNRTARELYLQQLLRLPRPDLEPFLNADLTNTGSRKLWSWKTWSDPSEYNGLTRGWERRVDYANSATASGTLHQGNTFLLADGVDPRQFGGLCLASQPPAPCSDSQYMPQDQFPNCSLWGRDRLYHINGEYMVADSDGQVLCRATVQGEDDLNSLLDVRWEHSCRAKVQVALEYALAVQGQTNQFDKVAPFVAYLQAETWRSSRNPYAGNGQCDTSSFRVDAVSLSYLDSNGGLKGLADSTGGVCVPCASPDNATQLCALSSKPHFANCKTGCTLCADAASLTGVAALLVQGTAQYNQWFSNTSRSTHDADSDVDGKWSIRVCRYLCKAGYTSSTFSSIYENEPCVSCNVTLQCPAGTASYMPVNQQAVLNKYCGASNMDLWTGDVTCVKCTPLTTLDATTQGLLVFADTQEPTRFANADCLARCGGNFTHKYRLEVQLPGNDTGFYPQSQLRCVPCNRSRESCSASGLCDPGLFLSSPGVCSPCNTAPCTQPGFYRTQCRDGQNNSVCAPCDTALLANPTPCNSTLCSIAPAPTQTRRWMAAGQPNTLGAGECAVTCKNNHMWVDAFLRVKPYALLVTNRATLLCVPCASAFVQTSMNVTGIYAMWNESGGVCTKCPVGRQTSLYVDVMCNLAAGVSNTISSMPYTTPTIVVNSQAQAVASYRQAWPSLAPGSVLNYYSCCSVDLGLADSTAAFTQCVLQTDPCYIQLNTQAHPPSTGCCTSNATRVVARRRLLQVQEGFQAGETYGCPAGSHKEAEGDGACTMCPQGSSTRLNGTTSGAECECFPGHQRAAAGRCDLCVVGTCRSFQEAACTPCKPGWVAPYPGSMQCDVHDGLLQASQAPAQRNCSGTNEPLEVCPAGFYCNRGVARPCPRNSVSAPGARAASDCQCAEGYYGTLGRANAACIPKPPGMRCNGDCTCPEGWSLEGLQCVSSCEAGTYTLVENATSRRKVGCRPCPLSTYSSSREAISAGDCIPCPQGFVTLVEGATAQEQCVCLQESLTDGSCVPCGASQYLDPLTRRCERCPEGLQSPMGGGVGQASCLCPPGQQSVWGAVGIACVPCPLGTYSSHYARKCTPCPAGMTTPAAGAKAMLQCRCSAPGATFWAGKCV